MADRKAAAGLVVGGVKRQRTGIGGLRRLAFAHQIQRQRAVGHHIAFGNPGSQRPVELHQRLTRAASPQIDPGQAQRHARMARINLCRAPEKPDRRFQIIHAHRRRPGFEQGVAIARSLGQRHQRAVQSLDFG